MMSLRFKWILLDWVICFPFYVFFAWKMGWWSVVTVPFALWKFFDGQMRRDLFS